MMRHNLSKVFWKNGRPISSVGAFIVQELLTLSWSYYLFKHDCSGLPDGSFSYHIYGCFSVYAHLLIFE